MAEEEDLFSFSTIEIPTVVGLLKNVLTQYPDNGQILKELVQNAEDAGATTFEVVHDSRSKSLGKGTVKRFLEAPALCVHNDAEFTEDDWHGIRMLSDSIKRDDLLKVGQFGLGFKSVFHFTDYITIISGENVLFMDPNEPEAKMCRDIPLKKLSSLIPEDECLDLWGLHLQKNHLQKGYIPGSIFWFPLRKSESKLSSKVYEKENVEMLFRSFSVEAPLCLTFLKSLESISITKIAEGGDRINILNVNLSTSSLNLARKERLAFRNELQACKGFPSKHISCKYDIRIETKEKGRVTSQDFKILQYLPCTPGEQKNNHMPLVGVAAPLPLIREDAQGQIFCFLPLPLETVNNTGLPIQINGYFVLDQNRRHVKWKTEESSAEPDVLWNESLVQDVLADAYYQLLEDLCKEASTRALAHDVWYCLLPDTGVSPLASACKISGRWKALSIKIWNRLTDLPIIYSQVKGKMMHPREVYSIANLSSLQDDIAKTVKEVLEHVGLPLAEIPENVEAVLHDMGAEPQQITPSLVRECLKNNPMKKEWNKLHLLEYVLSDCQYRDLYGIELLPLHDNTWNKFSEKGSEVYICTEGQASTFVGAEDRLLRTSLENGILNHLNNFARTGKSSLRIFDPSIHTTELLPLSVAHIQNNSYNHQELESWLQSVWSQLQHVAQLQPFEHLPLIPSSDTFTTESLISLSSPIIVRNLDVPEAFVEALRLLEVNVLNEWPGFVRHPDIHHYYCGIDGRGVLNALEKMLRLQVVDKIAAFFNGKRTEKQRFAFCSQLGTQSGMSVHVKNLLRKLHIFKAIAKSSPTDVCVDNVDKIFPTVTDFPVSIVESLLYPCNETMRNFALTLGAVQLTKKDFCLMALQNHYSGQELEKLCWYIICDHELSKSKRICKVLKNIRFISSVSGQLCLASELYDPFDCNIDALLGEGLVPSEKYKAHVHLLRGLGLKNVSDMPANELIKIIKGISSSSLGEKGCEDKVKSILRVINDRSDIAGICQLIRNVKFIKGVSSRPSTYPSNLDWATKNRLYQPNEVKSFHLFRYVAGSVIPLVDCDSISVVSEFFNWNVHPDIEDILQHFRNICRACPAPGDIPSTPYYDHLKKIYQLLQGYIGTPKQRSLFALCQEAFVFTENGFKLPSEVYIPSGKDDLQLLPYMHALPLELRENKSLFCSLGAFEKQSLSLFYKVLRQIQSTHKSSLGNSDTNHDLRLVVSVLLKLAECRDDVDREQLLIPVETMKTGIELIKVDLCAYSDQDCDWLDGEELGVRVIHKCVSNSLARSLGVEPLNKHLLADEEAVMEWGQHEPLTTRIHNLLRQYRDGVAVLKELVQNADDAGATKVWFLYDERQNVDSQKRLITEQLKQCQGPALWAYNNASFTEDDFENLCKLGGATKELLNTKIGKFGLGFCSVYNITDVPSFVSGSNYIIFDPHQKYLDSRKAGVRYDFSKKMNNLMLKKLHGQFQPFSDVFECHIQETSTFEGTLFRLPLRTSTQASESKLSSQSYSHSDAVELLTMFREVVGEILLFTQNIQEIKVFHVGKDCHPKNMNLLYESCRNHSKHRSASLIKSQDLCKPVENVARLYDGNHRWCGKVFEKCSVVDIQVACSKNGARMVNGKEGTWTVTWLNSWHSGRYESCKLAERCEGKVLSLACIALPVEWKKNSWKPRKLKNLPDGFYKESHMHCFLPLPVKSSLNFQVNGFFEVASDRTSLVTRTEDDRKTSKDWNMTLMKDAVTSAFLSLMSFLKKEGLCLESYYFSLWPIINENSDQNSLELANSFYKSVKQEDLDLFRNKNGWFPLSQCCFLSDSFYSMRDIGLIVFEFMGNLLEPQHMQVMELPQKMLACFGREVTDSVITERRFYAEYFLPNLSHSFIDQEKQNKLILHLIDMRQPFLEELKDICCIPTLPNGKLRKPSDLIDPKSNVAVLFSINDERFPLDTFVERNRRNVLIDLGMCSHELCDNILRERVLSVNNMSCFQCAKARSKEILCYLQRHSTQTDRIVNLINDVAFMPVKMKPKGWPMRWKGDEGPLKSNTLCDNHQRTSGNSFFVSPKSLCSPELFRVAGSTHFIHAFAVEKSPYPVETCRKLGVTTYGIALPVYGIISQIAEYREHFHDICASNLQVLEGVCSEIYKYLDYHARVNEQSLRGYSSEKIMLTKYGFVEPQYFAIDGDINCSPALFSVEREGLGKYNALIKSLGITQQFPFQVVYNKLLEKYHEFQHDRVPEEVIILISNLLNLLFKLKGKEQEPSTLASLYLPDSDRKMCPVKDLCINDGSQEDGKKYHFLHEKLHYSQEILRWLGIEEKMKKRFLDLCYRIPFGQSEPLTTRLKNILDNYPCDTGIMKELLQNADDAGASEIFFIRDERYLPEEKLFDKSWAPLQGPALCVYNNAGFTMKDLKGIQQLGNSTKIDDPASTGQYGIGFNAVYHLTDAPSFLTRGRDLAIEYGNPIPENEALCMFDPHCRYDPHATPEYPGAQLRDLNYMRKAYPDSFKGYLEDLIKEEGTVFRLPLRTYEESKIGKVMRIWELEKLMKEFRSEMKISLLFLRNVRKISLGKIDETEEISEEYSVELEIEREEKLSQLANLMSDRKNKGQVDPFFFCMQRLSYEVVIKDSNGETYHWLLAHQFGAETTYSLPQSVSQAFLEKNLRLLPQGGVAILLNSRSTFETNLFKNFCYLPLPTQSGFEMCLNGHFALDNSRRSLWIGESGFKAEWNEWLLKCVLAPIIGEAIIQYKNSLFPGTEELLYKYDNRRMKFKNILPSLRVATSDHWKFLVTWFYMYVITHKITIFDVFIPNEDRKPQGNFVQRMINGVYERLSTVAEKPTEGKLTWYALKDDSSSFPVYFEKEKLDESMLNALKRLGMKIASSDVYFTLKAAVTDTLQGTAFSLEVVNPENVLTFLLSWQGNCKDVCQPRLMSDIEDTPFLCVENVCKLLNFISSVENIQTKCNSVPLLVCSDNKLRHFDLNNPVYYSLHGNLFPGFQHEFIHEKLYYIMNSLCTTELVSVLKYFTLYDFARKVPSQYGLSQKSISLGEGDGQKEWIAKVWSYVVEEVERKCQVQLQHTYVTEDKLQEERQYILNALGEKTLYPVTKGGSQYLIPVKDASLALFVKSVEDFYYKLPVPHPLIPEYIPECLNLSATLNDPVAVLKVIHYWRSELDVIQSQYNRLDFSVLIEYFGKYCESKGLSATKLKSLKIYRDVTGCLQTLENNFIVATQEVDSLTGFHKIGQLTCTVILRSKSQVEQNLYSYVNPNCAKSDLDIFSRFILPNLSLLPENEFTELLEFLERKISGLRESNKQNWSSDELNVVAKLRRTPFITIGEKLVTADKFYDPRQPVFASMISQNLPGQWAKLKWHSFLCLAGMIYKLTGQMFVEFAQSLSISDENVLEKSKVLVDCLYAHFTNSFLKVEGLDSKLSEVKEIEFLIPVIRRDYENICPYYKTKSGLISFASSAPVTRHDLLWTAMSILPRYACSPELLKKLNVSKEVPEEKFFSHLCEITSVCALDKPLIADIMENIYKHLATNEMETFLKRLFESRLPLVYLNQKEKFVTGDVVVMNIMEEIEPYLYRAPNTFGPYFPLFGKLGVKEFATCDHFVRVLNMIHEESQEEKLHAEEARCMKLAMKHLATDMMNLQKITEASLYLPSKDDKLAKSSEIYVADNNELERLTAMKLDRPLFVGLSTLGISLSDQDFVKNLPEKLKPKFLSGFVKEIFDGSVYQEIEIMKVKQISEFISCSAFQKGMQRLLNHYEVKSARKENGDIEEKFERVEIKGVKEIIVTLVLHNDSHLGTRKVYRHVRVEDSGGVKRFTLYITKSTSPFMISQGLACIYRNLFEIFSPDAVETLMGIMNCLEKPQDIMKFLDDMNIKPFGESDVIEFFSTEIGTYLQLEFIELLDNDFCRFHEGEIVAMKKYLEGEIESEQDRIFIIVQVKSRVSSTEEVMNDKYEVLTGDQTKPIIVVKAHKLYKFMRPSRCKENDKSVNSSANTPESDSTDDKSVNSSANTAESDSTEFKQDLVPSSNDDSGGHAEEELSEEEIMKTIREQMSNIWRVSDEHERRHLVRRLLLKWHPDKNMDKQELCTRVVQYIQSLVTRLENGETIPDDDDHASSTRTPPSDFFRSAFRPPPSFNTGGFRRNRQRFRGHSNFSERTKMGDYPEAKKWMKQAEHDYHEASRWNEGSPCWIVYMCYQASEKALKAALYAEDCEKGREIHSGFQMHNLSSIFNHISSSILRNLDSLVSDIENKTGSYNNMQYPTYDGVPCDRYTRSDANFMLQKSLQLLEIVRRLF